MESFPSARVDSPPESGCESSHLLPLRSLPPVTCAGRGPPRGGGGEGGYARPERPGAPAAAAASSGQQAARA
eukprot:scaffold2025_cov386-Prasinococcus_capsulatus_cf.AAC.5